jgi:hypothetical protein
MGLYTTKSCDLGVCLRILLAIYFIMSHAIYPEGFYPDSVPN